MHQRRGAFCLPAKPRFSELCCKLLNRLAERNCLAKPRKRGFARQMLPAPKLSYKPANCLAAFWTAQDGPAIAVSSTEPGNVQDGFGVGSAMSRSPQNTGTIPSSMCDWCTTQILWQRNLHNTSFFIATSVLLRT